MRSLTCLWIFLLLAVSVVAQQKPAHSHKPAAKPSVEKEDTPNLPSEETVNAFMQQMFGYNPDVSWKVADIRPAEAAGLAQVTVVIVSPRGEQLSVLYVTQDGKHALAGQLIPFGARPFDPVRKQLESGITGFSRGPANAPATIVEFADLQCPHCMEAQPILERLLTDEPKARLVFQNFPLAIPQHDWAAKGADYADCVGRASNGAFWKFIHDVYQSQSEITAANADQKLTALADQAGVKGAEIAACAAKPETQARVEKSIALGKEVNVTGTPTLFVNGRKIENVDGTPFDVLKEIIEFAAKDQEAQQAKPQDQDKAK